MGSNDGSTLGLDFSKGLAFAEKVFQSTGFSVHPMEDSEIFTMVVSFGRHSFRLYEDSVAADLEAAIGGSGIDLMVFLIKDKVFGFQVSCKAVVGVKTGGSWVGGPYLCVKADGNRKQGTHMFTQVRALSMEVKPYFLLD